MFGPVNPLVFPVVGAILRPIANYVEKLIFNDPFGDVNKYYLIRNFFMTWGFIVLLLILKAMEKRNLKLHEAMNTISWLGFLKRRRLLVLCILASAILLISTYVQYIGIKFNPLSHYGTVFLMIYLLMLTFLGVVFLGEKMTHYKATATIFAMCALVMVWLEQNNASS